MRLCYFVTSRFSENGHLMHLINRKRELFGPWADGGSGRGRRPQLWHKAAVTGLLQHRGGDLAD